MKPIIPTKGFASFLRRSVTIQHSLPAIVKVEAGNVGVTATSVQSFGGDQFDLTQLEF